MPVSVLTNGTASLTQAAKKEVAVQVVTFKQLNAVWLLFTETNMALYTGAQVVFIFPV